MLHWVRQGVLIHGVCFNGQFTLQHKDNASET